MKTEIINNITLELLGGDIDREIEGRIDENLFNNARDIKKTGLIVINLWNKRLLAITSLLKEIVKLMCDCIDEQRKMIDCINVNLSHTGYLRKNEFKIMLADILNRRKWIKKDAISAVEEFLIEEGGMVDKTADILSKALIGDKAGCLAGSMSEIILSCQAREIKLANALTRFSDECSALKTLLQKFLSKGEKLTAKDFKSAMHGADTALNKDENRVKIKKMLDYIIETRLEIIAQWRRIFSESNKICL